MSNSFQIFVDVLKNNYFNFSGRVNRPGYWYFYLWTFIISFTLIILDELLFGYSEESWNLFSDSFGLAVAIPSIGLAVRRFHDTNRTGWWLLIPYIPLIPGALLLDDFPILGFILILSCFILLIASIVFLCQKSDSQANKYGPCPTDM